MGNIDPGKFPHIALLASCRLLHVRSRPFRQFLWRSGCSKADLRRNHNDHPDHIAFVRDRWIPEVEAFLEIDYEPLT